MTMFLFRITVFAWMFIFVQLFQYARSNVFTAVCKIEILAKSEVKMVEALEKYTWKVKEDGQEVSPEVQRLLSDVKGKSRISSQDHYVENPINAFHLVQRLYYMWGQIADLIFCNQCPETDASRAYNITMETIANQTRLFASKEDVKGAAVALLRLWHTYKLDIDKLIRGQILDTQTDPLTPSDILYISEVADEKGQTYDTIVLLHALIKALEARYLESTEDVKEVNIALRLAAAYSSYEMPWQSVKLLEEYQKKDPVDQGVASNITYFKSKLSAIPEKQRTKSLQPPADDEWISRYEALCRGERKRSQRILSSLKCFLRKTKIPIYLAKEEVLNYAPRLSLFYEVIFDSEAKYIKEASIDMLERSQVVQGNSYAETEFRISEVLGRRVELITGLSTRQYWRASHSEVLQAQNYGIGGMYWPHVDPLGIMLAEGDNSDTRPQYLRGSGDRMATWLYYLEVPKAGGATVFVDINITVPVVKGAAVFWYNFKRNGEFDIDTVHAGCPVLLGSKWIANKWIREAGQLFRRPCGKSPNSLDGPF